MDAKTNKILTEDYLEYKINIKRTIKQVISKPKKDEDGHTVKFIGDDGKTHTEMEWTEPVTWTLNMSNITLSDLINKAVKTFTIDIARSIRPGGASAASALQGTEQDAKDLMGGRTTGGASAYRHLDKLTEADDVEGLKVIMESIEARIKSISDKK